MPKKLLIIKASNDICASELGHVEAVAELFDMSHCQAELTKLSEFKKSITRRGISPISLDTPQPSWYRGALRAKGGA